MTELDQLLAMLDRCGVAYQRYDNAARALTEISISPPRTENGQAQVGPLTGDPWASTDFNFNADGQLVSVWMLGG